jgi:hypothetical protein
MPPFNDDVNLDDTNSEELDISAGLADIASELFGQSDDAESSTQLEGEDATSGVTPTEADGAPPQTESEVKGGEQQSTVDGAETGTETPSAPSTWSKEAAGKWDSVDPSIKAEILKREQDMFNGLEAYKGRAEVGDRYEGVIAEFKPILESEGIDPVEMFGNFAANHYLLSRGTAEQKLTIATNLLNHYGIHPNLVAENMANTPAVNPEVEALKAKIAELETGVKSITNREHEQVRQSFAQQVNNFAADPAHPHFEEVSEDIAIFLKSGVCKTLAEAYDKAVYANPVTRQKEIERITSETVTSAQAQAQTREDTKARRNASNVTAIPKSANGTVPVGTMDDTLAATLAAIEARG